MDDVIARDQYGSFAVSIKSGDKGAAVIMSKGAESVSVWAENYEKLFDEDEFDALRVSDKPECAVCGEEGAYHRYGASNFTIHPSCRENIETYVERIIEDNSSELVGFTI